MDACKDIDSITDLFCMQDFHFIFTMDILAVLDEDK